jgi:hypothetical protein
MMRQARPASPLTQPGDQLPGSLTLSTRKTIVRSGSRALTAPGAVRVWESALDRQLRMLNPTRIGFFTGATGLCIVGGGLLRTLSSGSIWWPQMAANGLIVVVFMVSGGTFVRACARMQGAGSFFRVSTDDAGIVINQAGSSQIVEWDDVSDCWLVGDPAPGILLRTHAGLNVPIVLPGAGIRSLLTSEVEALLRVIVECAELSEEHGGPGMFIRKWSRPALSENSGR